jgi:putative sigma-54 modulation protein
MSGEFELEIVAKGFTIRDSIKDYVESKLEKLSRFYDNIQRVHVVIERQAHTGMYRVQVTVFAAGKTIHAEKMASSIEEAIDTLVDVLERNLKRYKGRRMSVRRRAEAIGGIAATSDLDEAEEEEPIASHKTIVLRPMDLAEALEEMKLGDHKLFMYLDADTGNVCLLYKRDDGSIGMLEAIVE